MKVNTYKQYLAFASLEANSSQFCCSISPRGSTNLTPLSGSGLWDAVIISPIAAPISDTVAKWD